VGRAKTDKVPRGKNRNKVPSDGSGTRASAAARGEIVDERYRSTFEKNFSEKKFLKK
jgi:hypothetical protein